MSSLDKYRKGNPQWLVYYHKGEIKVSKGYLGEYGNFYLADREYWLTTASSEPMKLNAKGRVFVVNKEDIPKAKQMVYEHYIGKIDDIKERALASLYNIQNMIYEEAKV